jgi:hypothetical protein
MQSVRVLLAGLVAFLLTLVVAFVMAARRKAPAAPDAGSPEGSRRLAATAGLLIIVAGLGSAATALYWTDKIGVGMLASISQNSDLPPPPSSYRAFLPMSGRQAAEQSEWVVISQYTGLVLGGVAVALCVLTSFLFKRVWSSEAAWTVAGAGTVVLVTVAALYSHHLWSGAGWLQAIMRR